jgi:murein DD-endopeptidase MepM/ murein hydrolase activator NlpD
MRFCELASRAFALGIVIAPATSAATAGTGSEDPLPLSERVFFDRSALLPDIDAGSDTSTMVALRDGSPRGVVAEPALASGGRGAIVVAAVVPSKGETLSDVGPHLLPWSIPAVPRLLSTPAKSASQEAKLPVIEDPSVHALQRALATRPAQRPERALRDRRHLNEPGQLRLSRLPGEAPMSGRWSDPLGTPDEEAEPSASQPPIEFIMPFANGRVTSLFNQGRRHPAIDLAGALGSPVLATTVRQTVIFAGSRGGYGNAVITRDELGRTHLYGHLKSITSRVGQVLEQGAKLGHLGSTGFSTGPHVHYEVRDAKERHIDPMTLLFPGRSVARGYAWLDVGQEQGSAKVVADAQLAPPTRRTARPARAARHRLGMRASVRTHRWALPPRGQL